MEDETVMRSVGLGAFCDKLQLQAAALQGSAFACQERCQVLFTPPQI